jgi:hypothetical protein
VTLVLALLLVLGTLVSGRAVAAERDTVDVQSRFGLRLDLNLPRKWELDLNYRHRMVDDLSTHRGSYVTLKAERRLGTGSRRSARTAA